MKAIKIVKTFSTIEELNKSEEFKALWEGFRARPEQDYPGNVVRKAYVTENDDIYTIRELTCGKDRGLRLLHKLTIHTCLTNNPFMMGSIVGDTILINDDKGYDRCKANRVKLAELHKQRPDWFVTTS